MARCHSWFFGVHLYNIKSNFSNFDYMSLTPILCAFCYSLSMIIIKITSEKDNVYTQTFSFFILAQ